MIKTCIADVPRAIAKHQRWLDRQAEQTARLKPAAEKVPMAKAQLRSEPRA